MNIRKQSGTPKLASVAPLLNGIVIMFIFLNAVVAIAMYLQAPNSSLVVSNSYVLSYIWSGVFLLLALALLWGKIQNNWEVIRWALIAGLFIKALFTYALVFLGFMIGFKGIVGVTGLWITVTGIQYYAVRSLKLPGDKYVK